MDMKERTSYYQLVYFRVQIEIRNRIHDQECKGVIHTRMCRTLIEFAGFKPFPPFPLSPASALSFPFPFPPLGAISDFVGLNVDWWDKRRGKKE